ncbi:MAG: ABC transporter permease [Alphaproteobacteria bacterium]|nr:ABC transporter permease [Alphaproteobacteria bacterium]
MHAAVDRDRIDRHPAAPLVGLWRHRALIGQLTRRELVQRYRGSALGFLWTVATPLLLLAVYTFVFSLVFQVRWSLQVDDHATFALALFAGLSIFSFAADLLVRAPTLVLGHVSYVKKIVFPTEILVAVVLAAGLVQVAINTAILLVAAPFFGLSLGDGILAFPLVLVPLTLGLLGVGWLLAATGVYLRDLGQVIGLVTTVLMFLVPLFYPLEAVPERYRWIISGNPLTFFIEQARETLLLGRWPDWLGLAVATLAGWGVAWVGYLAYMKARRGFADVL